MTSWWRDQKVSVRLQRPWEPAFLHFRYSTSSSMRGLPIGSRFGSVPPSLHSRSIWFGCATCQAEDQQASGKRGEAHIVKDDATTCSGKCDREQYQRRTHQIERCDYQREPSENRIRKEHDGDLPCHAEPRVQSGLAGKSDGRLLDSEVAHVECVAERTETDDQ